MGQAKIISHLGDSKYSIKYLKDVEISKAKKTALMSLISEAYIKETEKQLEITNKSNEILIKQIEIDEAIIANEEYKTIQLLSVDLGKLRNQLSELNIALAIIKTNIASMLKEVEILTKNISDIPNFSAWCADYYTELAVNSIVPMLEVNDEYNTINKQVIIMPQTFRAKPLDALLWAEMIAVIQSSIDAINNEITAINERLGELATKQIEKQLEIEAQIIIVANLAGLDKTIPFNLKKFSDAEAQLLKLNNELALIIEEINAKTNLSEIKINERTRITNHKTIINNELTAINTSIQNKTPIPAEITAETGYFEPFINSEKWTTLWNILNISGKQKWEPVYRRGKILELDFDTQSATVILEPIEVDYSAIPISDNERLRINQKLPLYAVNCQYAHAGIYSFMINDKVIIDFNKDFNFPNIIGFESNPRPAPDYLIVDSVDNLLVSYYLEAPENVDLWQIKLTILDENKDLFKPFINKTNYEMQFDNDSAWVTLTQDGTLGVSAQKFIGQFLIKAKIVFSDIEGEKPYLQIFKRFSDFVHPLETPDTPHWIVLKLRNKTTLDLNLNFYIELYDNNSKIKIVNDSSTRLAPKVNFDGEFFKLTY